jgi:hypothetical protein
MQIKKIKNHLSSGAGIIGQLVADVQVESVSPHPHYKLKCDFSDEVLGKTQAFTPKLLRPAGMLGKPRHCDYQSECNFYVPNMELVTGISDLRALDDQTRREKTEETSVKQVGRPNEEGVCEFAVVASKIFNSQYYSNSVKQAGRLNWQSPRTKGHISNYH